VSARRADAIRSRGQSTVELALLLPVVVVLLLAVLQVGLLARDVVLVTHAAREAARAAAIDSRAGAARAAALAASGLDGERLEVVASGRAGPGSRVTVVVTFRAPTQVPIVGVIVGDRTIRAEATMRVEGPGP
jgi:Flp pilus assembly protein TadG